MKPSKTWTGFVLLAIAAAIGFWLMVLPSMIAEQYANLAEVGSVWSSAYLIVVSVGAVLLTVSSALVIWKLWSQGKRKRRRKLERNRNPSQMSLTQQEEEIQENLELVQDLASSQHGDSSLQHELTPLLDELEQKRAEEKLAITAFGTVSSGKSAVLNLLAGRDVFSSDAGGGTTVRRSEVTWPSNDRVALVDTPGLGEVDGAEHVAIATHAAQEADLVLLVVDGPLREHEMHLLRQLAGMEKPIVVCLNKSDWYDSTERERLQTQIREQLKEVADPNNFVSIRAAPVMRTRVRVGPDGKELEEEVEVPADIETLSQRMLEVVRDEGKSLLLANLLLQSRGVVEQAKETIRASLDRRAWGIVDKYTWGAGGAAALSPLPVLDLIAGSALTAKMVVDLAAIYRQPMDLQIAVSLLGQLGKNLLGIIGASAVTPTVTSLVASMLKSVPGIGTIAGGMLQGCVQALITRWIGAIFIAYLRDEMQEPEGGLAGLARRQWKEMTTVAELRKFMQRARRELGTSSAGSFDQRNGGSRD